MSAKKPSKKPTTGPGKNKTLTSTPASNEPEQSGISISSAPDTAESRNLESRLDFPIVGLGASAGGLDAFKRFFAAMPDKSGIGFVLIPHLDPNHKSLMVELIARHTSLTVVEAADGMLVRPDFAYVIPPNKYMTIIDGALRLSGPVDRFQSRTSIDLFLRSLAEDKQEKAICVILSGTGAHGTLGLKAVKAAGGMAMVQNPETTEYQSMPRSAIATGLADFVLPVEQMPAALLEYVASNYVKRNESTPEEIDPMNLLHQIVALLRVRTKLDFRGYRRRMIIRRIERRMSLNNFKAISEYLSYLREHPEEVQQLSKDLLISVTSFFRDPEAWRTLENEVIAPLVRAKGADDPIRIWSTGCATGEEAHSLGILVLEQLAAQQKSCPVQIFATDIDEDTLNIARRSIYHDNISADVTPERLARFFIQLNDSTYQVSKHLRDTLTFARHDLLLDPPFSKLDVAVSRNQLIYLEPDKQKRVIELLHFALNPGGALFLGSSETIGTDGVDMFEPISAKWRIYRSIGPTRTYKLQFPTMPAEHVSGKTSTADRSQQAPRLADLAQEILLRRFGLAYVVINRNYEVMLFVGPTEDYLVQPSGPPTRNVLSLARPGLESKLRVVIQRAIREDVPQSIKDVLMEHSGVSQRVNIDVEPLKRSKQTEGLLLLSFQQQSYPTNETLTEARTREQAADNEIMSQLELELETTRDDLQSAIEELESSNEELKASNEEVLSMNEELQSANEELESSKEELQSLNEELSTINNQLQDKIQQLETTANDMTNLFNSTDISTIFLDSGSRIKRFTPAATQFFNFITTDIGRPISDIVKRFEDDTLLADVEKLLGDLTPREREVKLNDRWWVRRVVPYRTADNRIDGAVMTFVDVTERKHASDAVARRLAGIIEGTADAILSEDLDSTIRTWNKGAERVFGYTAEEAIGRSVRITMPDDRFKEWTECVTRVARGEHIEQFETERIRKDGQRVPVNLTYSPLRDNKGTIVGLSAIVRDIGVQKQAEIELRNTRQQLVADLQALQQLLNVSARLIRVDDTTAMLQETLDAAIDITSAGMGTIQMLDSASGELRIAVSHGFERPFLNFFNTVREGQAGSGKAMLERKRIVIEDVNTNETLAGTPALDVMLAAGVRSVQSTPLLSHSGQLIGIFSTYYRKPCHPADRDLRFIDLLCRQVADWIERMQAEHRVYESNRQIEAILNTASDAIITFDQPGVIQSVNLAAERMFGYAASEMIGKNISVLIPSTRSEEHDDFQERYQHTKVKHFIGTGWEVEGQRKDGSLFTLDVSVSENGHLNRFTGILRDITYRKDLERDIVAIASLEQRRIGQDLHDDCGQQLTAIGLLSDVLTNSIQNKEPDAVEIAQKLGHEMRNVIQKIRVISRGLLQAEITPQDLPVALNDLAFRLSETSGVNCIFATDNNILVQDKFRATQLFHIAQEACNNAIRHAQAKNVQIHLRVINKAIALRIRDDGIGIPEGCLKGLGMRIMQNRASLIGATLTIKAAQPHGTLVTCSLRIPEYALQS
jgi:two-component system CheB/CheR fusion protein